MVRAELRYNMPPSGAGLVSRLIYFSRFQWRAQRSHFARPVLRGKLPCQKIPPRPIAAAPTVAATAIVGTAARPPAIVAVTPAALAQLLSCTGRSRSAAISRITRFSTAPGWTRLSCLASTTARISCSNDVYWSKVREPAMDAMLGANVSATGGVRLASRSSAAISVLLAVDVTSTRLQPRVRRNSHIGVQRQNA
jgi:hypothetical protein